MTKTIAVTEITDSHIKPSFLQKHFCQPFASKSSLAGDDDTGTRRQPTHLFSLLSRGCLILVFISLTAAITVTAVLVTVLLRRAHSKEVLGTNTSGSPSNFVPESPIQRSNLHGLNFPDPFVYQVSGKWYALATNDAAGILGQSMDEFAEDYGKSNIQVATSTDLVNWVLSSQTSTQVLSDAGDWSIPGSSTVNQAPPAPKASVWAPDLYQQSSENGSLLLYYSAASSEKPSHHCIGIASTSNFNGPSGPFKPVSSSPLVCPLDQGGAIDAATFTDSKSDNEPGDLYTLYKIDGNSQGSGGVCDNSNPPQVPTPIMLQKLTSDALHTDGVPTQLLDRTPADGPLVEAPVLVKSDEGTYFLFFSSGCTRTDLYDVEYATADNVTGPYTRASEPLLETGDFGGLVAPGSVAITRNRDSGQWVMAFAARIQSEFGGVRELFATGLEFDGREALVKELVGM